MDTSHNCITWLALANKQNEYVRNNAEGVLPFHGRYHLSDIFFLTGKITGTQLGVNRPHRHVVQGQAFPPDEGQRYGA